MLIAASLCTASWLGFLIAMYLFIEDNERLDRALARGCGRSYTMSERQLAAMRLVSTLYSVATCMATLNTVVAVLFPTTNTALAVFVVAFNVVAHALLFSTADRCREGLSRNVAAE